MTTLNLDSIDSREDFKWDLIIRAHKERAFRDLLRSHPQAALQQALGTAEASGVTLTVHQERPTEVFCLINYHPNLPAEADQIEVRKGEQHEAVLVKKAWKDRDYRRELLANPMAKYGAEFGSPVPKGVALRALEESRDTLHLILPPSLAEQDLAANAVAELSDTELDAVAGGLGDAWQAFKTWVSTSNPPSGSANSGSCGCVSASGVRG